MLTDSDEKVDHEADVEGEVDLLAGVLVVRNAVLHSLPAAKNSEPRFPDDDGELTLMRL